MDGSRKREEAAKAGEALAAPETGVQHLAPIGHAARFRGQPLAFGSGARAPRVTALLDEASRASGLRLSDLVDEVRYLQGSSYFEVIGSKRVMVIGSEAFGKTRAGQLIEGSHEIGHAQVFDRLVQKLG